MFSSMGPPPPSGQKSDGYIKQNSLGGGGFVAFDATYAELGVSIIGEKTTTSMDSGLPGPNPADLITTSTRMGISLLGKYPFELAGGKFTVFPLLGAEVMFMLHQQDEDGDTYYGEVTDFQTGSKEELSQTDYTYLAFKLGVGGDFNVTDHIFIRGEFLYGIRLPNGRETAVQKKLEAVTDKITALPHGPQFKLGVGYKF